MYNYEEGRKLLKSGDIVFFHYKHKLATVLCKLFTGSEFSHCAIVWVLSLENDKRRVLVVEQHQGGQRIVSLSSYAQEGAVMTVVRPTNEGAAQWKDYYSGLLEASGSISYGYLDYVAVGLKEKFGLMFKDFKGEICSEMIAKVLKTQGEVLPSTTLSPGALFNYLLKKYSRYNASCYTVTCTIDPAIV